MTLGDSFRRKALRRHDPPHATSERDCQFVYRCIGRLEAVQDFIRVEEVKVREGEKADKVRGTA